MKAALRLLCIAGLAFLFVPAALAGTHVSTPSTWTLNVAASDFGGGPAMKSDVYVVLTDTEKWLKWTDTTVDDKGKTIKSSWTGPADGTMKPIVGMPGAMAGNKSADDSGHTVLADGTVIDSIFTLSADKKQSIFTQTVKTKDGKVFHQKLVYDRTK
jgi:hypothetical protein